MFAATIPTLAAAAVLAAGAVLGVSATGPTGSEAGSHGEGAPPHDHPGAAQMAQMHDGMMAEHPQMARMHQKMMEGHPGMAQMHERMMGGTGGQMTGGDPGSGHH